MKENHCLTTKITLLFFILVCIISCTKKKYEKNEIKTLNNESAATETAVSEEEPRNSEPAAISNWQISADFRNNRQGGMEDEWQVGFEDKTPLQAVKDIFLCYDLQMTDTLERHLDGKVTFRIDGMEMILYSVQPAKIPIIDIGQGQSRFAFFASFRLPKEGYPKEVTNPVIYLLFFYEKDGQIYKYDYTEIGYSLDYITITQNHHYFNTEYDWVKDMPWSRFGNSSAIIGDFNGDGYDEIMLFEYEKRKLITGDIFCNIYGFDDDSDKRVRFETSLWVWLPGTWDYGSLVQFGTYNGIEGFIIYEDTPTGEMAKQYYGPNQILFDEFEVHEGRWHFYTWDKEEEKYVFIDKVNPDEIKTQWSKIKG
jgi:hypothetical protein